MTKILHFVSGLPRSCSTLLCNLLAQNPRIHASPTSALHEIGYMSRHIFQSEEASFVDKESVLKPMYLDYVRGGCVNAYNSLTNRPVVVDKHRSWIGHPDQLFQLWPEAKVIVPIRDIRGIISSMEKKRRKHPEFLNPIELQNPYIWTTIEKRVQGWLGNTPVGIAIDRLLDASTRFSDRIMFVHAEELTSNPQETMNKIWNYLGEQPFNHDTKNVLQYTKEIDAGFPYGDHVIKQEVEPLEKDWNKILGANISEMINQEFKWINDL